MAEAEHEIPGPQEVQALARKWLELGQAYLAGLAASAAPKPVDAATAQAGGAGDTGSGPGPDPFHTGTAQGLIDAWRSAWAGLTAAQAGSAQAFADWMASMPAVGPAREHTRLLRELAEAQAECRRLEQELSAVLMKVHADALELLTQRMNAATPSSQTPGGYREIYDLWVECGEQVYARVAHSDTYCRLQGALGNATMRLRSKQQALIEQWLKQLDLPTRSELNTLHRQVRELRQEVAAMQTPPAGAKRRAKRT